MPHLGNVLLELSEPVSIPPLVLRDLLHGAGESLAAMNPAGTVLMTHSQAEALAEILERILEIHPDDLVGAHLVRETRRLLRRQP